ncbi:MAG: heavy metal-associated domain-containing protein [Acidobacteria bacterium]|nr:heavy metal-associated domain-containing protein [Acidobacteriota bacterium]
MPTTSRSQPGLTASRIFLLLLAMTVITGTATPGAEPTGPAAGDSSRVRVKVDGLTCPFCAHGLEKNLKKIPGVMDLEILVDEGTATLIYAPDHTIDFDTIRKAVRRGGFTPTTIHATLTGTLVTAGDDLALRLNDPPEVIFLAGGVELNRLRAGATDGERVTISGEIQDRNTEGKGAPSYALTVDEFSAAAAEAP